MHLMNCWKTIATAALAVVTLSTAQAVPVMDGSASPSDGYGPALSVQNTQTQFGDNSSPDLIATASGGSEINQVFGVVANGRLYVTITGNLETNFNKMEVFIDSATGGVNEIVGSALPAGVDAYCCGGPGTTDGALQRQDFLKFDAGFDADYYLTFSNGGENVSGRGFWGISAHYADLTQGTAGAVGAAGFQMAPRDCPTCCVDRWVPTSTATSCVEAVTSSPGNGDLPWGPPSLRETPTATCVVTASISPMAGTLRDRS